MNVYPSLKRKFQYIYKEMKSSTVLQFNHKDYGKISMKSTTDNTEIKFPNVHLNFQHLYNIISTLK